jgi:hypothetical protein
MNKTAAALSILAVILVCTPACEQQTYDETKMFNQSDKVGGHGQGGDHKDAKKEGDAAKTHP